MRVYDIVRVELDAPTLDAATKKEAEMEKAVYAARKRAATP